MISISYTITKTSLISVQNQYDLYFRYVYLIFVVSRGYKYLQYKDEIPFPEMKHIKNIWIPGYIFSLYPLFLNTLELYNLI